MEKSLELSPDGFSPEPSSPVGTILRTIKAEANLLRLPLFALSTKGLRTLDGVECRGKWSRDGVAHEFVFRATRNLATSYPGPLARSAHLGFLDLATERGFPLENPVTWTWRDLCRRMRITYSGRTVLHLKEAIRSTKGLLISSYDALVSKRSGELTRLQERNLSLYDEVTFASESRPDGHKADLNCLWFSGWYLENLNAFFTAPLDYDLWRRLNDRSTIASRLYEFLLLNFHGGIPVLRINYETLARFLPVQAERYLSDAKRQLGTAFTLLVQEDLVESAAWSAAREGIAQLHFLRGPRLVPPRERDQFPIRFTEEDVSGAIEVEELRTPRPPEWLIVADFYRLWLKDDFHRPTSKELVMARDLVERYGATKLKAMIQLAVKRLKAKWPGAKSFGGMAKYIGEVAEDYEREASRADQQHREQSGRRRQREELERQRAERERFEAAWRPVWQGLAEAEREAIRREVVTQMEFLARMPRMIEGVCLDELARRRGPGAG